MRVGIWIYEEYNKSSDLSNSKQITLSQSQQITVQQEEIVPPSLDILESLYQLAKKGDVYKILEEAAKINESNSSFTAFTKRLVDLASTFQLKPIQEFIKQYLIKD